MSILTKHNLPVPPHRPTPVFNGCGQGCIKMIIAHFEKQDLSVEDLNRICGVRNHGDFSSMFDMAIGMVERGYEAIRISDITPEDYLDDPVKYMRAAGFNPENNAAIIEARKASVNKYIAFRDEGKIEDHPDAPTMENFEDLIKNGYVLISWVNSEAMAGDFDKTCGHYVVPIDVTKTKILYHDVGTFSEFFGHHYSVAMPIFHDTFLRFMQYPASVGLNPKTQKQRMMGLMAFKPKS